MKPMTLNENQNIEKEICAAEQQLLEVQQKLVDLHQKMQGEETQEYDFIGPEGALKLSELFGDKDELIVVHNMGQSCTYCTLWADGFNGFTEHLNDRVAFALTSPDDFKQLAAFAEGRGWRFNYYSTQGQGFQKDMGFRGPLHDGSGGEGVTPGISFFYKEDGKVYRKTRANLGPGDLYCSVWHLFARLNKGVNNWQPKYNYN